MKVLILGCGPAGLMAAHAAAKFGANFAVYSKRRKSFMNGAQYLHAPIPGMSVSPSFTIRYQLSGDADVYRDKVYGDRKVEVSPESLVGNHDAWDIRETYDRLWDAYSDSVFDEDITPERLHYLMRGWKPDLVISTIPAKILCHNSQHKFESEEIWSTDKSQIYLRENTVLCNGAKEFSWYRVSKIQGHENTEWPGSYRGYHGRIPGGAEGRLWRVVKPISTTCSCFPMVHRMGRYGKWTKGVLSHHAWEESCKLIGDLFNREAEPPNATFNTTNT